MENRCGDGNVIYDQTGNLNHATRQTATWGTSSPVYVNPIVNKSVDEDNSISVDISAFSLEQEGLLMPLKQIMMRYRQ